MGMRNNFPKERHYEFWNILMCHLISRQESLPEKDRTLFGTLAYRMMTKAAEAIPVGEVCLAPGKETAISDIITGADVLCESRCRSRGDGVTRPSLQFHWSCARNSQALTQWTTEPCISSWKERSPTGTVFTTRISRTLRGLGRSPRGLRRSAVQIRASLG